MTIITQILRNRIQTFIYDFNNLSRSLYVDENGILRHPGEFGGYREKIVFHLLKPYIPNKYTIADGFMVDSLGEVSTQCDIVIFSANRTCFIENESYQKFFISQSVQCIGEIKSVLTRKELKEALKKLAQTKKLRLSSKKENKDQLKYKAQPLTFLICEKLNLRLKDINKIFEEVYSDIPRIYRHNLILSLNDGLFTYYMQKPNKKTVTIHYPTVSGLEMKNLRITSKMTERTVQLFCSYIKQHLETCEDEDFEFLDHLPDDELEELVFLN